MKLGQTSIIHFGSRLLASALGFFSTVYIARLLGADVLGIYSLGVAVVSWFGIVGNMGVSSAITKRVSEGEEPGAYAVAGIVSMGALFGLLSVLVFVFRARINSYIGFPAALYVLLMLGVTLGYTIISSLFQGRHMVHLSGLFSPVKIGSRAILQIGAIIVGLSVAGLFGGYILAYALVILIGAIILVRDFESLSVPSVHHFEQILSYAKYSWLGSLRSKAFDWVDIAVLGFFVSQSFIGYYTAAWNISVFLILFGSSIRQTIFPEMSETAAGRDPNSVSDLLEAALSYAGLILIPGLVGASLLGTRLLRIYGDEFTQATTVLTILIIACLLQAYQSQITTTLNAVNRPDLAFRVNAVFLLANVALNVAFIYFFGWIGAAVATAASVGISLVAGYAVISTFIDFEIPANEIARQWLAAGLMGVFVQTGLWVEATYLRIGHNLIIVFTLVSVGAVVYFLTLLCISTQFRTTVGENLPDRIVPATIQR